MSPGFFPGETQAGGPPVPWVAGVILAPGTDRDELRIGGNLQPPARTIGEVPVEDVQAMLRHEIEQTQHEGFPEEVARLIEHEPAVAETRMILDGAGGESCGFRRLP